MIRFSFHKKLKAADGEMQLQLDCKIEKGQVLALYGESGAGKTSILRMLAGLMSPEKGHIEVNGEIWLDSNSGIDLKPQKRKTGFVFQDYALFPNMTVRQNLEFALDKHQEKNIVNDLIEIIELGDLQHRKPETLSGGQKQRTALARALVRRPQLLLLDEPLSALDYAMRSKLQDHILQVHRQFNLTTILVSHEVSEVFKMADYVLELELGKVIRQGTPSSIFSGNDFSVNLFEMVGEVVGIIQKDGKAIYQILIGRQVINISPNNLTGEFSVGDKIVLGTDFSGSEMKKMQ